MFRPSYPTLPHRILARVKRIKLRVFATADFSDLSDRAQVSRALAQLVAGGELARCGYGLYARPDAGGLTAVTNAALARVGRRSRRQLRWNNIEIRADRARKPKTNATAPREVAARLREAFELHEAGVAMYRATLKRRDPEASAEEINSRVRDWLGRSEEHGLMG